MVQVLDDIGFVDLIDSMGSDSRIAQAARRSTGKDSKKQGDDERLVRRLRKDKHTSPFESVVFTFHVKAPMMVLNQWVRHRTGSFSVFSKRYSEAKPEFYVPISFHSQHTLNKQMSGDELSEDEQQQARLYILEAYNTCFETYKKLIDLGVSREISRSVLPEGLYTEFYWTVNLHNLFHFLKLRLASDAQWEIQEYARALGKLIEPIVPVSYEAFLEFDMAGQT